MSDTLGGVRHAALIAARATVDGSVSDTRRYYNRGLAYYDKKDYARARADWEKTLRINPNITQARDNLEVLRGMGY